MGSGSVWRSLRKSVPGFTAEHTLTRGIDPANRTGRTATGGPPRSCVHRGWLARRASQETVANSPRATQCPRRRPWRGAPGFPGDVGNGSRIEARQGAIRVFSGNSMVFRSAPRPTIPASPDARSRDPSPPHDRGGNAPAFSRSETSQDRASGVRGGWVRCASGSRRRRRMMGRSMRGSLKKRGWLPAALPPPYPPLASPAAGIPPNDSWTASAHHHPARLQQFDEDPDFS